MKIGYLAAICKPYNISFFFIIISFYIVHIYMVQISSQNSAGKVVFYGWVLEPPPWALTEVEVPWSLTKYKHVNFNGSQLAKMKKSIPDTSLP